MALGTRAVAARGRSGPPPLPPTPPPRITNASVHAQWAVVFAQLSIAGQQQGIHGFLVRWGFLNLLFDFYTKQAVSKRVDL